ncbi:MAG: UDP-glucose 4-epimerase GalE [Candidatus Nomurabacteria bacterium]|nr:MAG: UDP-glucose 4-epimerase GalE [Candidatus Nomurabacteria bacterium]
MNILVTGGAGYIGSHTVIELIAAGYDVVVVDSLINSSVEALYRVEKITGNTIPFYEVDVRDTDALGKIFSEHSFDAVIHFAGLKAVGESVAKPLLYYKNNLDSTLTLLEVMQQHNVKQVVFSSSATVYGTPEHMPLTEDSPVGIDLTNPYGKTKYMCEEILRDAVIANDDLSVTILRYFNPIGAHESGLIGEDPKDIPNNLMPYIAQVAVGKRDKLSVFGDDYDTVDGTGVRDYIHVVDLARGHVAALTHMRPGAQVYNLGTGRGTSVLELIHAFEEASGKKVPYIVSPRRAGDIAACYADVSKAERELSWQAKLSVQEACRDSWNWQSQNPDGFSK